MICQSHRSYQWNPASTPARTTTHRTITTTIMGQYICLSGQFPAHSAVNIALCLYRVYVMFTHLSF